MAAKPMAGTELAKQYLPLVGGGEASIGGAGRWQLIVSYRGKHCPLCKIYLKGLEELKSQCDELGVELLAVSADPKEKAEPDVAEMGLTFPVAYDHSLEQMRELGLYISNPRNDQETDRPFAEPGVFVINPEGVLQIVDISNAPFVRPDLKHVLRGVKFVIENDYPIRGTAE